MRGRRVAFATAGSGPPLLCDLGRIHHLAVFWRYRPYRRLVEALAGEFTVVRFDRPGCGLSDRAGADFSVAGEVALFDELVGRLRLRDLDVLAWGSSAPAMIAVAALRPERVRRLVLVGAGLGPRHQTWEHREELGALLRTEFAVAVDLLARRTAAGCDDGAVRWLSGAYRQAASSAVVEQWLAESAALEARAPLALVRCPTLLLHRRGDRLVDLQEARDLAAQMRDALLLPLDGAESVIWEGDQESLVRPLRRFLDPARDSQPSEVTTPLTGRERAAAELVADGLTNAEIGERLGISARTVDAHLQRARAKLGLRSRADLAAWIAAASARSRF